MVWTQLDSLPSGASGPALDDPDGGQLPGALGVQRLDRLLLHELVELLVEAEVVGVDGVEAELGPVQPLVVPRSVGLDQRVDPGLLHVGHAAKGPQHDPVGRGRAAVGEVAVRDLLLVAGRQEQVAATLALVGSGDAHVGHIPEPEVVDHAQRPGRRLDHRRPPRVQVEHGGAIGGLGSLGIGGQGQPHRVGSWIAEADHLRGGDADRAEAATQRHQRGAWDAVEEHLDPSYEVEGVVDRCHRVRHRHPVEEPQRPERRLHHVSRRQGRDRRLYPCGRQPSRLLCRHRSSHPTSGRSAPRSISPRMVSPPRVRRPHPGRVNPVWRPACVPTSPTCARAAGRRGPASR